MIKQIVQYSPYFSGKKIIGWDGSKGHDSFVVINTDGGRKHNNEKKYTDWRVADEWSAPGISHLNTFRLTLEY